MAPLEDLHSRDLAWISEFVTQQMVIMLRPMMDHLMQTDASVDYMQRVVQRLGMDVSEVRSDVERTNKCLAILRQGIGVQNEGKCLLQRSIEGNTRTVKRLDDQMESLVQVVRGIEDSVGQICADLRVDKGKQEDVAKQVSASSILLDEVQAKMEKMTNDAFSIRDDLLRNDARLEVWQRELRELRRNQLGMVQTKMEDSKAGRAPPSAQSQRDDNWPQKKSFAPADVHKSGGNAGGFTVANNFDEPSCCSSGSSQQSKRISRMGSGSGNRLLQQEHLEIGVLARNSAPVWSGLEGEGPTLDEGAGAGVGAVVGDESPAGSRLPLLGVATRPQGTPASRAPDRGSGEGPRLRFTATLANPPSRGSPT
mmetsp:Transcript_39706/g.86558  ORF Transcript_39706/g.86558 Transcript_39706/m.86558 type:complete len:367 (-) Transcript_39706:14-1114(-)